jgi:O-antigen ligase
MHALFKRMIPEKEYVIKCLYITFLFFVCGFFFLPIRVHRDLYYVLLILPFLFILKDLDFKRMFQSNVFKLSLLYVVFMIFTVFWAEGFSLELLLKYSRRGFTLFTFLIITAYLLIRDKDYLDVLFKWSCRFAGFFAFSSMIWFYFSYGISGYGRLISIGPLDNPILAGNVYAGMALVSYYHFSLTTNKRMQRLESLIIFIAILTFVVLTQSRGPLMALFATMFFCSALVKDFKLLLSLAILVGVLFIAKTFNFFDPFSLVSRGDSYRFAIWEQVWTNFLEKPFLGYGLGGLRPEILIEPGIHIAHAHNVFLANLLDGGGVALALLLALLLRSAYWAFVHFKKSGNVTLVSLILFAVLANMTDGYTLIMSPGYQWIYFWMPIAIISAFELHLKEEKAGTTLFAKSLLIHANQMEIRYESSTHS